jgi:DNA-binding NarL/FixJ family response regulator
MGRLRRPWTTEEDELLRQLVAQGHSRHAIAVQLGRDDRTVDDRAKAIQVELKVRGLRRADRRCVRRPGVGV